MILQHQRHQVPCRAQIPRPAPHPAVEDRRWQTLRSPTSTPEQISSVRESLIEQFLPLVHRACQPFRDRGEPYEDLVQIGCVGLLAAIQRFDPEKGQFTGYAASTMTGELRRHFRDRVAAVYLPRKVLDSIPLVHQAAEDLQMEPDATGGAASIAEHLHWEPQWVEQVVNAIRAKHTLPLSDVEDIQAVGADESEFEQAELRAILQPAIHRLDPRDQQILFLRFTQELSQAQIAERLEVSQMLISRRLREALNHVRSALGNSGKPLTLLGAER